MDKKIIAVDFDGTLSKGAWPGVGVPNFWLIEKLRKLQQDGHKLILWTCREGEALKNAIEWCESINLVFDAINDNLPEVKEMYENNSRKISCDIYIDDKSCIPEWNKAQAYTNSVGFLLSANREMREEDV